MRTKLLLEQFNKDGKLIDRREQFSRSFTLNFIRLLYVQHSQLSHLGLPVSASNLQICSLPGFSSLFNSQGQRFGIVVGSGAGAPAPSDTYLFASLCHGRLYKAGAPAPFLNPSFETGDFTSWTNSGGTVLNTDWLLKVGTYFASFSIVANATAYIEQSIDLTNVTAIVFQVRAAQIFPALTFRVKIDGTTISEGVLAVSNYPLQIVDVSAYLGAHTIRFEVAAALGGGTSILYLDDIHTYGGGQLEFGGCELNYLRFGAFPHNGEFTIQRYFTNHCGNNVSVTEAGMVAYPGLLIAHDTFGAITLADGQLLRASYIPQITV